MTVVGLCSVLLFCMAVFSCKKKNIAHGLLEKELTDIIRGVAIFMILIHHAETNLYEELPHIFSCFIPVGAFGTAIFFFLSGYGNHFSINKIANRGGELVI